MKEKSFILTAITYVVGSIFIQGLSFLTIPIFTRLLTPEDFGIWGAYSAWVAIISIFIGLKSSSAINNAKLDFSPKELDNFAWSTSIVGWMSFIIIIIFILIFRKTIVNISGLSLHLIILGVIEALFTHFFVVLQTNYVVNNQSKNYLIGGIANSILTILISIVAIQLSTDLKYMGRVYGGILSVGIMGIISLMVLHSKKTKNNMEYIKYGLILSGPLIFQALSNVVLGKADQIMLLKLTTAYDAGIYNFSSNLGHIISVIYLGFNQAFVPWYFSKLKEDKMDEIIITYKEYIKLFILIFIGFLCLLPEVIIFMGNGNYHNAVIIVPIIAIGYYFCFIYSFPVNYEFYHKKTTYISIGSIGAAIINIFLNLILIPKWGAIGAAVATMLSYVCLFLFHYIIASKIVKKYHFNILHFLIPIIISFICLIMYYFLMPHIIIRWVIAIIAGMLVVKSLIGVKMKGLNKIGIN